jgi:hypothetical protein
MYCLESLYLAYAPSFPDTSGETPLPALFEGSNILENIPVLTTHQVSSDPCRFGAMYFCMTLKDLEMIDARENKVQHERSKSKLETRLAAVTTPHENRSQNSRL